MSFVIIDEKACVLRASAGLKAKQFERTCKDEPMLCAIRISDNKKVLACDEVRTNRPFFCPLCEDEAILKKGTIKIHHFAHKPPVTCEYGRGETEKHRMCKMEVFEGLKEHRRFRHVELEKGMGTVRPDISALMGDPPIAIEVQISTLTMDQIVYRTREYAKKGIYLLWLPIYNIYLDTEAVLDSNRRVAQLAEHCLDMAEVWGSTPHAPTNFVGYFGTMVLPSSKPSQFGKLTKI